MRRAAGLITDGGGVTCHAAIVSRELQLPCVVGTGNATTSLRTGQDVTVDGRTGKVYAGVAAPVIVQKPSQPLPEPVSPLATRLYVNLAVAEHAEEVAALPVDGVGLLKDEGAQSQVHICWSGGSKVLFNCDQRQWLPAAVDEHHRRCRTSSRYEEVRDEERNRGGVGGLAVGQGCSAVGGAAGEEHRRSVAGCARSRLALRR